MSGHFEDIKCPDCRSIERASVVHTVPWWSYIHECSACGYTIMESEWELAKDEPVLKEELTTEGTEARRAMAKAFALGFMISREGYNGECPFEHLAPSKLWAYDHEESVEDFQKSMESQPEFLFLRDRAIKFLETEFQLRASVPSVVKENRASDTETFSNSTAEEIS